MGSVLSLHLPAAPPAASKATQTEWNCPVCHSVEGNTAAVPCGHRFCLGCLLRRAAASATCPLCTSPVLSARFAVLGHNDFLQCLLGPAATTPRPRRGLFRLVHAAPGPAAMQATQARPEDEEAEEDFPVELWAELLQGHEQLLEPVRPWLRRSLDSIYGAHWWEARQVETIALATLCICGPDRAELTHMLQCYLGDYTAPLTRGLVHVALHGCREAWLRHRDEAQGPAACAGRSSPELGLAPDPAAPGSGERPGQPESTAPSRPPATPGQEQNHGEAERRRARARLQEEAQAPGPSAPRRGRNRRAPGRVRRRSEGMRAWKSRQPVRVRRRKPRRK